MQRLVTRIIRNDVSEKPTLVSIGFGHFRAWKQAALYVTSAQYRW
jgi:hypothetical protein